MAPTAVETNPVTTVESLKTQLASTPLVDLRAYPHFDNTPGIGTEFRSGGLQIADILSDQAKLAALARLVSERGVVFFREADITPDEQKTLVQALGEHSDITFENVPSDYASLVIRTLPTVGGDTLWASAYDAYDRLSAPLQSFLESLKAEHSGENFLRLNAVYGGNPVREPRGAPENVGQDLLAVHPVIRTNPVTGWKGLFVNKAFTTRILELSKSESDALLEFLFDHVSANHDIQVRFRWEKNSLAIWDNRSTFHAATADLDGVLREGTRSVSLGERPFFDPQSRSRREDLEARAK
ncbi:hypothetical protein CcaverHIS641_0101540 [Cutaneotrichosporon cavernicola]|nr:hypothetical protein CcaverHIS641_0101540 [Cutaneotrichosporon cavernicola]